MVDASTQRSGEDAALTLSPERGRLGARRRGKRLALLAAAAGIAAVAAGYLTAPAARGTRATAPPPATRPVPASAGSVLISVPSNWQRRAIPPTTRGLTLTNPLAFTASKSNADERFVVGSATDGTGSTLLPAAFRATLRLPPHHDSVQLGANQFYRYRNLMPAGATAAENVYALPTSSGTIIAVCQTPATGATAFASTCEHVVASLRLTSGHALRLGPNPAYAASLGAVISALNSAQRAGEIQLRAAKDPRAQSRTAKDLSGAYTRAANQTRHAPAGPAEQPTQAAIVTAMRQTASAYAALARAADSQNSRRFTDARGAVSKATQALVSAVMQLRKLGYPIR